MNSEPTSRAFIPLSIAVLTVSDTRVLADDKSGDTLAARLTGAGHRLAERGTQASGAELDGELCGGGAFERWPVGVEIGGGHGAIRGGVRRRGRRFGNCC